MHKIRKAVFPVAGFGTRFLPATKAMPKELMPVVDKSLIHYAVEEAIVSGLDPPGTITVLNTASVSARNIQIYTF
jgi:UTP--glucose-1-phosphate uridylyltransferase